MSTSIETRLSHQLRGTSLSRSGRASRRLLFFIPIAILLSLSALFGTMLNRDPELVPSALIGKPVPSFTLPPVLAGKLGLASSDLKGAPSLVNVFASWCTPCRAEHPLLLELKEKGIVQIHGLNYKDQPLDVAQWLSELGNPYTRTGADLNGRVAIDWGVYGVPETFVISSEGRILYKHIGPLTEEAINKIILPLIPRLSRPSLSTNQNQR